MPTLSSPVAGKRHCCLIKNEQNNTTDLHINISHSNMQNTVYSMMMLLKLLIGYNNLLYYHIRKERYNLLREES